MKILLLNEHSEYLLKAKAYCKENWEGVYYGFCTCLNEAMETTQNLPNTYIVLGGQNEDKILGFYQLNKSEYNEGHNELTPWITTIFVDPICRGGGFGEMLLNHAKYEAAKLGYDKVYLSTTHIGYYEKYGFEEIGMDICSWDKNRGTKIYQAYTPSEILFKIYNKSNPKPDWLHLALAEFRWGKAMDNPALLLRRLKYCYYPECNRSKWFTIVAYKDFQIVGMVNFMRNPKDSRNWYLGDLAVYKDFCRQKIATKLITRGLEIISSSASGGEFVYAYIEKENLPSIKLHQDLGFANSGEIKPFGDLIHDEEETTWILKL